VDRWSGYLNTHKDRFLGELLGLLRIKSVSTDPAYQAEVRGAARWTADRMHQAGIEGVRVMETGGHPVVYGEWLHAPGKPTVLIYGHFDVQPADPLQLWTSPPFEPLVRDGRVYARGASDMKGNLVLPILACEAWLQTEGALPVNVKFLFEGEEEIGSPSLAPFITDHRELLACDVAVSADSAQYNEEQPALWVGLRGLCGVQIGVRSAATDLHSGVMGGIAPNAVHALVRIIDSLRSPDGRILVKGFYDDVLPLSQAEREALARLPDDTAAIKRQTGIRAVCGEPGFTPLERNWVRPTLDVNGMWGGFQGEGSKTIIPCEAHAKITCRLVPNQHPERILECLKAHIAAHSPAEVAVSVSPMCGHAESYMVSPDHWGMAAAGHTLATLYGKAPFHMRMGATVPVTALFLKLLGVDTVSFGFGMDDEQIHAPDEFIRLSNFEQGQRAFCMLLPELGLRGPAR
jgi:acetylornithine deacetylase/succinyl-diaminopimelate desuccinylase-like protein